MTEKQTKRLVEQIQGIVASLKKQSFEEASEDHDVLRVLEGTYVIHGQLLEEYEQIVDSIVRSSTNKCSIKYVESALDEIISEQIKRKNSVSLAKSLQKILEDANVVQITYVPVAGVKVVRAARIANVQLINSDKAYRKISSSLKKRIARPDTVDRRAQEQLVLDVLPTLKKDFQTGCCAVVEVAGDSKKAQEITEEECSILVDLLRFGSFAIYQRGFRVPYGISIQSNHIRSSVTYVTLTEDGSFGFDFSLTGQIRPFEVNPENMKSLKKLGLIDLAKKRTNGKLTRLDDQLFRAIHRFAESQAQNREEDELLDLVICLEMLLGPSDPKSESISGSIADGVALLLFQDLKTRLKIRQYIKKTYDARSRVAHGDKVPGGIDMPLVREIVFRLILLVMKKSSTWTTIEDIRQHVNRAKLK